MTGGTKGAFDTVTDNLIYTLVVTPTAATNDGVLTITVAAGAATAVGRDSLETSYTQAYDTLATTVPNHYRPC